MSFFRKVLLWTRLRGGALILRIARRLGVPIPGVVPLRLRRRAVATGLFDEAFYLHAYPDVRASPMGALDHFLVYGAREGRNPNAVFSIAWYVANTPALARSNENPILHYARVGEAEGRAPSRTFDPTYYLELYPELAAAPKGLLAHYLRAGRAEGRRARRGEGATLGEPATAARIVEVKPLAGPGACELALVFCPAPGGRLPPHAAPLIAAFRAAGRAVALVVASDAPFEGDAALIAGLAALYVREPSGGAFAAFSHVLQLEAGAYAVPALALFDGGALATADPTRFGQALDALSARPEAVCGLHDSYEGEWHIAGGLLHLKAQALRTVVFQRYMSAVRSGHGPRALPQEPEALAFAASMRAGGLTTAVLHPALNAGVIADQEALARSALDRAGLAAVHPALEVVKGDGGAPLVSPQMRRATRDLHDPASPLKIDYIGPWSFESGLGAASRGMVSALWRAPVRLNLRPIRKPFHIHARTAPAVDAIDFCEPADAAIVHLNPDGLALLTTDQREILARARVRIGLWVWETDPAPPAWTAAAYDFDAVWAPSRYCAEIFARAFPGKPVHVVPHVVETPAPTARADRRGLQAAFGVPADRRLILYVFDGASVVARKNPAALARAFMASGLAEAGWTLVLKTKNLDDHAGQGRALRELAQASPHIILIDAKAGRQAMSDLMAAADIYASPHCAEGFGLTVAEAMALGKSVVATDYSGVRDLLDADCGYPVAYGRETLEADQALYHKGERWARIDETALATALLQAAADLDAGRGPGARARARIARTLSPDAVAAAVMASLAELLEPWDRAG